MTEISRNFRRQGRVLSQLAVALIMSLGAAGMSHANHLISADVDFFKSLPGTEVDLSLLSLGIVPLEGVPFDPDCMGEADTIVQRNTPVPIGGGTIDIEIVALQLKSIDPVDLTPLGGPFIGVFADLYTTINVGGTLPDVPVYEPLNPSMGRMEIQHQFAQGGTFDSCFGDAGDPGVCATLGVPGGGVYADAIFVIPGSDPNFLGNVLLSLPSDRISLFTAGSSWVHNRQLPVGGGGPGCGPFGGISRTAKVIQISENGPHPVEPVLFPVNHYKVYNVDDVNVNINVTLVDQFHRACAAPAGSIGNFCAVDADCDSAPFAGDGICQTTTPLAVNLNAIDRISNPVLKLPENTIEDPAEHQVWYRFLPTGLPVVSQQILVHNQFGEEEWTVNSGPFRWLLTPAEKDAEGPPIQEHHYLCYPATGPPANLLKDLQDQFGLMSASVLAPEVWCNPVEKTHNAEVSPMVDPDQHLACYDIDPKVDLDELHFFVDQFGPQVLNVRENRLLCVPSYKTVVDSELPSFDARGLVLLGVILLLAATWAGWSRRSPTNVS